MKFDDYWNLLEKATPGLADGQGKMTISVAAFRKVMARCHHEGFRYGLITMKSISQLGAHDTSFEDMLRTIRENQ